MLIRIAKVTIELKKKMTRSAADETGQIQQGNCILVLARVRDKRARWHDVQNRTRFETVKKVVKA